MLASSRSAGPAALALFAIVGCCAATAPAARAQAQSDRPIVDFSTGTCPLSVEKSVHSLRNTRMAIKAGNPVVVVAFGSSSTQGHMASDPAHNYPSILQNELAADMPDSEVTVLNRGIGGQDAPEELARINDVIEIHPALVIWQVGTNGAIRNADPEVFKSQINEGIWRFQNAGIDVILMDNQRAPAVLASGAHSVIENALAEVAVANHVAIFHRGALMDTWETEGAGYDRFISPDGLHHNDLGYKCVAEALASTIYGGLQKWTVTSR